MAGLTGVVQKWVQTPAGRTAARTRGVNLSLPFDVAAEWAASTSFSAQERANCRDCARLLALVGLDDDNDDLKVSDLFGEARLHSAARARLPDVITSLLLHPSCNASVVNAPTDEDHTAFSLACGGAVNMGFTKEERADYLQCARALAVSRLVRPDEQVTQARSDKKRSHLFLAIQAGLADVIGRWQADGACTPAELWAAIKETAASCKQEVGAWGREDQHSDSADSDDDNEDDGDVDDDEDQDEDDEEEDDA